MSTIIVGVDASERSLDALAFAREAAAASHASIVVANTFPYENRPSRMANLGFRKVLEDDAQKLVNLRLKELGGADARTAVVARYSPAHGLQDLAVNEHAALIVVGSSHVGRAGRVLPGSTGERLLHGAPCPVAIVPKGYHSAPHRSGIVGVAYDGSTESEAALATAIDAARATGSALRVIMVLDATTYGSPAMMGGPSYDVVREDLEKRFREHLDQALARIPSDIAAEGKFLAGDPAHELLEQTGTLDLLVTGSRGYGPLHAVMTGGVTGRLVRDAACPVIVLPRGVESPLGALFGATAEASA